MCLINDDAENITNNKIHHVFKCAQMKILLYFTLRYTTTMDTKAHGANFLINSILIRDFKLWYHIINIKYRNMY